MIFSLGSNCVVSDIVRIIQPEISVFDYLGIYNIKKFCPLLLSDGSDWFGKNTTVKIVGTNLVSVLCNKYGTRALHDVNINTPQKEAIEIVTNKRRKLFQNFKSKIGKSKITFI